MGFVMEPTSASKQDYKLCRTTATAATATTTAASTGTATATAKHYSTVAKTYALATYTASSRWLLDIVDGFVYARVDVSWPLRPLVRLSILDQDRPASVLPTDAA